MTFMLYIARDKRNSTRYDLGSALCLRALEVMPAGTVEVREVDGRTLPASDRPAWLTGTPTLVAASGGDVLRGHEALAQLQHLAVNLAAQRRTATSETGGGGSASARRVLAPNVHLRAANAAHRDGAARAPSHTGAATSDDTDATMPSLWDSQLGGADGEEEDAQEPTRKVTADDLHRAVRERETALRGGGGAPQQQQPPPPPPFEDE